MKTPLRARRIEDKEKRREAIIDSAEKVFTRLGFAGATFGAIARQSKLSRSLIYVYFPTKDDLIHSVCERGLRKLEIKFLEAAGGQVRGIDKVISIARAYVGFSHDEPLYFSMITELDSRPAAKHPNSVEKKVFEFGRRLLEVVAASVSTGRRDGTISSATGAPALTAISVWAFTHGVIRVSTSRQEMLEGEMGLAAQQTIEHGLRLLRLALSGGAKKPI